MKKILSILLSVLMVFSCCSAMMASAASDHLPQIYVEGLESKGVYYKEDVNMENPLFFPIDGNKLFSELLKYEPLLKEAFAKQNSDLIAAYLTEWIMVCFGDVALGKDGYTMSDKVMVPETELIKDADNKYTFKYDCRLGGVDVAVELADYIERVKADSGYNEVELVASSYGSAVVLALLHEYSPTINKNAVLKDGQKDILESIDSILLCVPSAKGVDFASELFSGNIDVKPEALKAFLDDQLNDPEISNLLSTLIKTGTIGAMLDDMLLPFVNAALMNSVKSVILNVFGTMPSMWSFVDDEHFVDALINVYGEDYASEDHEYAGLINRITYYHNNIQNKATDILKAAEAKGHEVNIICKYGDPSIPISTKGNVLSDGFVAVTEASFGATASLNQQTLPADYTQAKTDCGHNHMSDDRCIDASTCDFPENTWFIKNLWHGTKSDAYYTMINEIVYNDITVHGWEKYPQFLVVPEDNENAIVSLESYLASTEQKEEKETTWLEDFLAFLKGIIPRLIEMIKGLFNK